MSAPVIDEHDVTVHLGDVREVLAELPAASVQCVVTSPPYYGLRDYGVDGQIGLEASPAEYVAEMVAVFAEVRRVLADDGVLWLNLGDSYASSGGTTGIGPNAVVASTLRQSQERTRPVSALPAKNLLGIPWRTAFALQDDGWILRAEVIWSKRNCMPEAVNDRPSRSHEQFFLFSKKPRYWYDADAIREESDPDQQAHNERYAKVYDVHTERADGRQPNNQNSKGIHSRPGKPGRNARTVWTVSSQPFPGAHFATMPPELARRCIVAGCPEGATVLDPFTGSGTTAKVARQLGRRFVGVELNPDYIDIIRERIGQTPFDFGASA
jgi:DNA modification methylase